MVRVMEEAGEGRIRTFLDEKDVEGGEPIAETIRMELRRCDEFVVLLSSRSKDRPWVLAEIGGAWVLDKRIIAIIDKVTQKEIPEITYPYKTIDLNNFDLYVTQLLERAKLGASA